MNIKKFTANNAQEAIQLVKREMGAEAVILRTRTLPAKGLTGQRVEVTAAVDYEAPVENQPGKKELEKNDALFSRWNSLEKELKELKETILSADAGTVLKPEIYFNKSLRDRYTSFKAFGLKSNVIRALMAEYAKKARGGIQVVSDPLQDSLAAVLHHINTNGKQGNGKSKRICAFIGPTGVGKTTTLAKLAAINAVKGGNRAALITVDTFRIGAVAQMETYARIMEVPLETATSNSDLEKAIRKHENRDLILIDTAGRSPSKNKDVAELKSLFTDQRDIHYYLVLSAMTRYRDLLHANKRFGELPFKSYIFTKLDETQDPSSMLNFLISQKRPVSYFTTGQQVPDDIEIATRKKLASLILGRLAHVGQNRMNEAATYGSG